MENQAAEAIGPIDYLVVEWRGERPHGELAPHLVDLVDRGIIRILDLAFVAKDEDGNVAYIELDNIVAEAPELTIFEGASSGLLGDDERDEAGAVLEPGTAAAILVYENTWAAPFATALRGTGGEVVASGRITVDDILAALDAAEAG